MTRVMLSPPTRHPTSDPLWFPEQGAGVLAGDEHVSVIGGAAIFDLFEPLAHRIELTEVLAEIAGDVTMPDLRSSERWSEESYEDHEATGTTPAWRTITLVRA